MGKKKILSGLIGYQKKPSREDYLKTNNQKIILSVTFANPQGIIQD